MRLNRRTWPSSAAPARRRFGGCLSLVVAVAAVLLAPATALYGANNVVNQRVRSRGYDRPQGVIESLEWVVADSDLAVVGRFMELSHDGEARNGRDRTFRAVIVVDVALKGRPATTLAFPLVEDETWARRCMETSQACLFFFNEPRDGGGGRDVPGADQTIRPSLLVRPMQVRGLLSTAMAEQRQAVGPEWMSMDFRLRRGPDEVLDAVWAAARAPAPPGKPQWIDLPFPNTIPAPRMSPAGAPARFRVPVDARLERLAREWLRTPGYVDLGLLAIQRFNTDENAAALRSFADDPLLARKGSGRALTLHYPRRAAAQRILDGWGAPRQPMVIDSPWDDYRPARALLRWPTAVFGGAVAAALLARPRLTASRNRRPFAAAMWRAACLVALAGAAGAAALAARGRHHADEITFATGDARHWVSSVGGGVQWVSIRGWPARPTRVPLAGSFVLGGPLDGVWRDGPQTVTRQSGRFGFGLLSGTMADETNAPRPYRRVTVPAAPLAAVALGVPLLSLLRAVARRQRERSRRRGGRCLACDYDLRGGHARCPECGRRVTTSWRAARSGRHCNTGEGERVRA